MLTILPVFAVPFFSREVKVLQERRYCFFFVNVVFVCLFVLFVFFKFHEVSSLGL